MSFPVVLIMADILLTALYAFGINIHVKTMKAKTSILFILAISGLLIVPGCKKFLQKRSAGTMTQGVIPGTASDALLATNAVYTLHGNGTIHSGGYPILDIMSDDARKAVIPSNQLNTVGTV